MRIAKVECFQVAWPPRPGSTPLSAWLRIWDEDGRYGLGEASPMFDGYCALTIVARHLSGPLIGADPMDRVVLNERLAHQAIKIGPDGALAAALAAIDIALWDLIGKRLEQPLHKLLGGAWRGAVPFYTSFGHAADLTPDAVVAGVQARLAVEKSSMVKLRISRDRLARDADIPGDLAKARALREALGPDIRLAFDGNNGYSIGGAIRVGRALEALGYLWFEEPVQHYHEAAIGDVARRLDIPIAAGEQSYTLAAFARLIASGVRILQPDVVKMGGITGLRDVQALAHAHGVDVAQHQTQPTVGQAASLQLAAAQLHGWAPLELNDASGHQARVFRRVPVPRDGVFQLPDGPGLGLELDEAALAALTRPVEA